MCILGLKDLAPSLHLILRHTVAEFFCPKQSRLVRSPTRVTSSRWFSRARALAAYDLKGVVPVDVCRQGSDVQALVRVGQLEDKIVRVKTLAHRGHDIGECSFQGL
jgi:hypothetical protein